MGLRIFVAKFWGKKPSTYLALVTWGASGFMASPTLASGVYHAVVVPICLAAVIWFAHHEGRKLGAQEISKKFRLIKKTGAGSEVEP